MSDIYIIYREGVYMQGIVGVFDDFDEAEIQAVLAMDREKDDYHIMVVIKTYLNKRQVFEDHYLFTETRVMEVSRKNSIINAKKIKETPLRSRSLMAYYEVS